MQSKVWILIVLALVVVGLIAVFVVTSGQKNRAPIDEDTFIEAYVQLATLAERTPIGTPEYDQKKSELLSNLGVEAADVEGMLAVYDRDPKRWARVWEKISQRLSVASDTAASPQIAPADTGA